MKRTTTYTTEISREELQELINRNMLNYLDRLEIDGSVWRVIKTGEDGVIIQKITNLKDVAFNRNGSNEYEGSDIERYIKEEFPKEVPEWLREEAEATGGFILLSKEEVKEYMPREIDRVICDKNGDTDWWWTRSANRSSASNVWFVSTSGLVYTYYAYSAIRCAPACKIRAKR